MATRRPHRKSRLGCKRCKVRRMKCDETHPICMNCSKHDLECDFNPSKDRPSPLSLPPIKLPPVKIPLLRRSRESSSAMPESPDTLQSTSLIEMESSENPHTSIVLRKKEFTTPASTSTETTMDFSILQHHNNIPMRMGTPSDRLLDLKLMHHFMSMSPRTYFKLLGPQSAGQVLDELTPTRTIYVNWIMQLAFTNQDLMDALLGFSAFNLRRLDSSDRTLARASHVYLTRAISAHTAQLSQSINDSNGEVLFATACLIAFTSISSQQYISSSPNGIPLHWFQPWNGPRAVAAAAWNFFQDPELKALLEHERINQLPPQRDDDYPPIFDFLLDDLDREATDPETVKAYDLSVLWLTRMYHNPHSEYVFKFTTKVQPKFVKMLEQKDPRTLTIVGYFFMLLRVMDKVWWLPVMTKEQFWALVELLPDEWRPKMEWAAKEFKTGEEDETKGVPIFEIKRLQNTATQ
ncbi:uncharacterized protein RSE6_06217 [Rhynchosporium secalis]|uniref:Zn(2)-C6 fungal-type domain-containing protein n=1 Tax=Rhynchosporium secalis TaxID=38038 RepID=A0A1E1M9T0_RHYSE|nr:uncharacterized protein RSE6_06217 [Rhynchosporium secalis]